MAWYNNLSDLWEVIGPKKWAVSTAAASQPKQEAKPAVATPVPATTTAPPSVRVPDPFAPPPPLKFTAKPVQIGQPDQVPDVSKTHAAAPKTDRFAPPSPLKLTVNSPTPPSIAASTTIKKDVSVKDKSSTIPHDARKPKKPRHTKHHNDHPYHHDLKTQHAKANASEPKQFSQEVQEAAKKHHTTGAAMNRVLNAGIGGM